MPTTARAITLLAAATTVLLLAGPVVAWAAETGRPAGWAETLDAGLAMAHRVNSNVTAWVVAGYARRPLVMIGLGGVLLLPPLAITGLLLYRRRPQERERHAPADAGLGISSAAWVEVDGRWRIAMPSGRDFMQIGRERDNDVCLDDDAVHRYHAIIERAHGRGFTITDIGGPDGNGLCINGARLASGMLANGDTIELGSSKLRFATAA